MKTAFRDAFLKDLKGVKDKQILKRVHQVIQDLETAETLSQIPNLKKLSGTKEYFRIRLGDYRIGLALENDAVVFVRLMNRKDIYRYFP